MAFYPTAIQSIKGNSAGGYTGGPFKGVLHTTEGSSAAGAISAFKKNNSWPHFLIDAQGHIWQFIDTSKAGRALRNLSGGVQTNTDSVVQFEIVGFAGNPNYPPAQMDALRAAMRWVEQTHGVQPIGPGRPFATAYGQNYLRFPNAEWDAFNGWCGHCHVPENTHWDPGAINLTSLLPTPIEETAVAVTVPRPQGGYIVLQTRDGGVFTYGGAPFFGSVPSRVPGGAPSVSATWTPSGNGYWILGTDGSIKEFGDAQWHGGLSDVDYDGNRVPIGVVAAGVAGYIIVTQDPSGDSSPYDGYFFGN